MSGMRKPRRRRNPNRSRPTPTRASTSTRDKKLSAERKRGYRTPRAELTAEEEVFAQHYAIHKVGADAVRHAWPEWRTKPDQAVAEKASKLRAANKIQARIRELSQTVAEIADTKFAITAERVLNEIAATAFANAGDYFDWGVRELPRINRKTGQPMRDDGGNALVDKVPFAVAKPSSELTREQKAAVVGAEQTISRSGDVTVSVKLANKLQALALLLEHVKPANPPASLTVNAFGSAQVVIPDSSAIAQMSDPKEALRAFEAARASLARGKA